MLLEKQNGDDLIEFSKILNNYGTFNDFKEDEAKGEGDEDSDVVSLLLFAPILLQFIRVFQVKVSFLSLSKLI